MDLTGKVSAKTNVVEGYQEEFCYKCTVTPVGGAAQVQQTVDNLKIIQEPADCSDALVEKKVDLKEILFKAHG